MITSYAANVVGNFAGRLRAEDVPMQIPGSLLATLTLLLCLFIFVGVPLWIFVVVRRRHIVANASLAIRELATLTEYSRTFVPNYPSLRKTFSIAVNSKARFDRFDLNGLMATSVLDIEEWLANEIRARTSSVENFEKYQHDVQALAHRRLGRSGDSRIDEGRFRKLEHRLFLRRQLSHPTPSAHFTATVSYRSPKGQNSYSRSLNWNYDQLRQGFGESIATRARQSTTQALRQRERSLMSTGLRMEILQRDGLRCRMCGATASDGVALHVDHINPSAEVA